MYFYNIYVTNFEELRINTYIPGVTNFGSEENWAQECLPQT